MVYRSPKITPTGVQTALPLPTLPKCDNLCHPDARQGLPPIPRHPTRPAQVFTYSLISRNAHSVLIPSTVQAPDAHPAYTLLQPMNEYTARLQL